MKPSGEVTVHHKPDRLMYFSCSCIGALTNYTFVYKGRLELTLLCELAHLLTRVVNCTTNLLGDSPSPAVKVVE